MVILPTKVKLFTAHLSQKTKMGFLVMTLSFPPALSITGCIHTAPPAPSTTRNTGQQSYGGQLPWTCQCLAATTLGSLSCMPYPLRERGGAASWPDFLSSHCSQDTWALLLPWVCVPLCCDSYSLALSLKSKSLLSLSNLICPSVAQCWANEASVP
jgi:hypothetical protein